MKENPRCDTDVLVVGAGPVGLVVANELAMSGMRVVVWDRADGLPSGPHSRANVVWPRNLELLRRISVTDEIIGSGHRIVGTRFHADGKHLGTARLSTLKDCAYRFAVMIPQLETQAILARRAADLGVVVRYGHTLVGLDQVGMAPGGVTATAAGPHGEVTTTAQWIVGADGAGSAVRQLAGIQSVPTGPDVTFGICDALVDTRLSSDHSHYLWSRHGAMAVASLGELTRLAVNIAPDLPETDVTTDLFRERLAKIAGTGNVIDHTSWTGRFRVRCHVAERFVEGRVVLVGDAAHVVSPAGGQGMNTGIGDAVNLSWRLVRTLRSGEQGHVDAYAQERRMSAARTEVVSAMMTRAGLITSPRGRLARNALVRGASASTVLDRTLAPTLAQTSLTYAESPRRVRYRPGDRAPALPGADNEPHWSDGRPVLSREHMTLLVRGADVPTVPGLPQGTRRLDVSGSGRVWGRVFARSRARAVLVRPDGHIEALY